MEYGKIIYDFLYSVMSQLEKLNDIQKKEELVNKIEEYFFSKLESWSNLPEEVKKVYNDIALNVIREYIKSSPL